jgi:hypothetical protein
MTVLITTMMMMMITMISVVDAQQLAANSGVGCIILLNGRIQCWGTNKRGVYGALGILEGVTDTVVLARKIGKSTTILLLYLLLLLLLLLLRLLLLLFIHIYMYTQLLHLSLSLCRRSNQHQNVGYRRPGRRARTRGTLF